MELDKDQAAILESVVKDVNKKQEISIGGYAGTGKTFLVRAIQQRLPHFAVCAFTGKAASVLRKKGLQEAQTIHSLIYTPIPLEKNQVIFERKSSVDCAGFIVDEASMVSSDVYSDLKFFGKPIIFVGDHGQLEPIGNNPNLMKNPDYKLEKVHRNAGEIAHFAEWIRLNKLPEEFPIENKVEFVPTYHKKDILSSKQTLCNIDQVICAYNATRVEVNSKVRGFLGYQKKVELGEKVICLR